MCAYLKHFINLQIWFTKNLNRGLQVTDRGNKSAEKYL